LLLLALSTILCSPSLGFAQDDPFAAGVRMTPWLSPADEQQAFKLPPGFEIQLVAAEPDIQKPLNMAFDERGRIWLTCTIEYPYAAPPDRPGRDTIKVLEDTNGDGRFEKVTTFADGLNIPMGIYPWKGGCVAFSIPNIWHFEDTDGDGVCDKRTVLYGPFDTSRDTHGMVNSFRRGWDGWIYACHGFNNDSRVKGRDGHEIHMQSGNVFRFQLDGSRIEHFTHGQVNPFGMCFDELFNIFTADCHSKPIYQLLRGGYYPSFGKPHDGLGFVPPMMDHTHGSTAICGLAICTSENFPAEYRGDFFSGNVMTSRINRNKPEYHGSTIKAIEQPDFLTTSDPWFRPVDIHFGPDGAMYILDFYNRIIGHYEVPLPHPGRDRTSGRIWRIVYKPDPPQLFPVEFTKDISNLTSEQLLKCLARSGDDPRALSLLRDRGVQALPAILVAWDGPFFDGELFARLLWLLESEGALTDDILAAAELRGSTWIWTQLMKILAEREHWNEPQKALVLRLLKYDVPFVSRAAADALARHPEPEQIKPLLHRLQNTPVEDTHLRQSIRMALRDHIAALSTPVTVEHLPLSDVEWKEIAAVCIAVPKPIGAAVLVHYLRTHNDNTLAYLQHAARYADSEQVADVVRIGKARVGPNLDVQSRIVLALAAGLAQRPESSAPELQDWAKEVAMQLLARDSADGLVWRPVPIDALPTSENPWIIAPRPSRDGDKDSLFFYSLPKGEQRTGIYRSAPFALPETLSFWCAGHSGPPRQPLNSGNYVRLRDAQTHEVLAVSRPPRNDVARRFEWDLTKHASKQGYVELVDGDTGNAYAWLAVGRFSLAALNPSDTPLKQQRAAEIIGKLKLVEFRPHLASLLANPQTDSTAAPAIAQALVALDPDARAAALAAALADPSLPDVSRPRIGYAITVKSDSEYLDNLREIMKRSPTRLQATLAETLTGDTAGASALLSLIESGYATPRLLQIPNIANKLAALKNADLDKRTAAITARMPAANSILEALIIDRRRAFPAANTNLERGEAMFAKHCAACHQLGGKGTVIGPQLDGIGNRGLDRLLEDILDPNRNVDVAFRTTTLRLTDGRIVSGLVRREEGTQLILADAQGKEFTVAKTEIDQQQKTELSLMPANVGEVLSTEEFFDLAAYLLGQRHK
jgi:putative heme-binding domain-containing protein